MKKLIRNKAVLLFLALFLVFLSIEKVSATTSDKVVFLLLDGVRADTFASMCAEGELPTFNRLKNEGLWVDSAISVFPSTTGPAYAPFVTGLYPCTSGLAGIRQYIRKTGTYRSYCGTDALKMSSDMNKDYPTIYELLPKNESLAIMGVIDRGAKNSVTPLLAFAYNNMRGKYTKCDKACADTFLKKTRKGLPKFSFVSFHAPDSIGHKMGSATEGYRETLRNLDAIMTRFIKDWEQKGELDNILLIISADHGHQPVDKNGSLAPLLESMGLKVQDAIGRNTFFFNASKEKNAQKNDVIVSVSGNACVQLYLKGRQFKDDKSGSFKIRPTIDQIRNYRSTKDGRVVGDLIEALVHQPCVGFIAARDGNSYRIFSNQGQSLIKRKGNRLSYQIVSGNDPLFLGNSSREYADGRFLHERDWLKLSANDAYPDAIFQISQLLESENSGDLIINAAPGYEPWFEGQKGVHGGLDKAQMQVPLLLWGRGVTSGVKPVARTVDVFPTMLKSLGLKVPAGLPGIPLL